MVIEQVFNNSGRRYIRFGKGQAKWCRTHGRDNCNWSAEDLIGHMNNIYVVCGDSVFRQKLESQWKLIVPLF